MAFERCYANGTQDINSSGCFFSLVRISWQSKELSNKKSTLQICPTSAPFKPFKPILYGNLSRNLIWNWFGSYKKREEIEQIFGDYFLPGCLRFSIAQMCGMVFISRSSLVPNGNFRVNRFAPFNHLKRKTERSPAIKKYIFR